jgi:chromate transporter
LKIYKAMLPGLNAAAAGLIVSSLFSMYDILRERSAFPNVTTAITLLGAVAVDGLKVPAPLAVVGGGILGVVAWAAGF